MNDTRTPAPTGRLRPNWRGVTGWAVMLVALINLGRFDVPNDGVALVTTALLTVAIALLAPVLVNRLERDTRR